VERIDGQAGFCGYGDQVWTQQFARKYFEPEAEFEVRQRWHWGAHRSHMTKMVKQYGLVLRGVDLEHSLGTGRELIWPRLLELVVPLPQTWEAFIAGLSSSAKNDFRKVKRLGITSRICDDKNRLREYYEKFYVLSMAVTHQDRAAIQTWEYVKNIFEHGGEFFELWRGDEQMGGFVGRLTGNTYWFHSLGWKSGDAKLRKNGMVAAVYFEIFKRALDRGVCRVRLGGVAPTLEGKLLAYKSKWRSRFSLEESDFPDWKVSLDTEHPSVRWFFERSSLVVKNEKKGHFEVLSGRTRDEGELRPELMENIGKWHLFSEWAAGETSLPCDSGSRSDA
jgi:hypothetical protein